MKIKPLTNQNPIRLKLIGSVFGHKHEHLINSSDFTEVARERHSSDNLSHEFLVVNGWIK
jgi:hypothetical protein